MDYKALAEEFRSLIQARVADLSEEDRNSLNYYLNKAVDAASTDLSEVRNTLEQQLGALASRMQSSEEVEKYAALFSGNKLKETYLSLTSGAAGSVPVPQVPASVEWEKVRQGAGQWMDSLTGDRPGTWEGHINAGTDMAGGAFAGIFKSIGGIFQNTSGLGKLAIGAFGVYTLKEAVGNLAQGKIWDGTKGLVGGGIGLLVVGLACSYIFADHAQRVQSGVVADNSKRVTDGPEYTASITPPPVEGIAQNRGEPGVKLDGGRVPV